MDSFRIGWETAVEEDGSVGLGIVCTAWVVWTTQMGLLIIEVAEPVPS